MQRAVTCLIKHSRTEKTSMHRYRSLSRPMSRKALRDISSTQRLYSTRQTTQSALAVTHKVFVCDDTHGLLRLQCCSRSTVDTLCVHVHIHIHIHIHITWGKAGGRLLQQMYSSNGIAIVGHRRPLYGFPSKVRRWCARPEQSQSTQLYII